MLGGSPCPCAAKNYEEYARSCIHLAQQADTQELRDMLMRLARIWVRASLREEALRSCWPSGSAMM
jgi:hypothetical protein